MRVLVTGASGCIGSAVIRALVRAGHEVVGLSRRGGQAASGIAWIRADIRTAPWRQVLVGCDAVVHLAALVHHPEVRDFASYAALNVEPTRELLRACTAAAIPTSRVILSSTVAVYGDTPLYDIDESWPCKARDPYGLSKLLAEQLVRGYGGMVLRLPLVYGPHDRGNMGKLMRAVKARRFVLPTPATDRHSLVAAENVAEAVRCALAHPVGGAVYHVTDGHDLSLEQIVTCIVTNVPARPRVPRIPAAVLWPAAWAGSLLRRCGLPSPLDRAALARLRRFATISSQRVRDELGYSPVVTWETALGEVVALQ